jgi:inner membrane protein
MQKSLLYKLLAIGGLTLLICIALAMIGDTVRERAAFRQQAVASIANDSVRQQTIAGPVLVIPYHDEYQELVSEAGKDSLVKRVVRRTFLVYPNQLGINGSVETHRRYRGIHQVLVYSGQHRFEGDFTLPALAELPRASSSSRITLGGASIALGIDDVRGIRNIPQLDWNGARHAFTQGSGVRALPHGLHAPLGVLALDAPGAQAKFAFDLGLDGIERLDIVPLGHNNSVTLKSNWPHPQFGGHFLPTPQGRVIDEKGFTARWDVSSLASNAQQQVTAQERAPEGAAPVYLDRFGVGFVEPVNIYSLAERATKYGLLFVTLTFAAFFIFEVLRQLPIHPVQYLLVGLALALFFLLLVSLSEHIDFGLAYLAASDACVLLIGYYLAAVLRDWRRGAGFGAALGTLYAALYGLLISENNALVLGSLLLFAILAAVMVATRKVDWYAIGKAQPQAAMGV